MKRFLTLVSVIVLVFWSCRFEDRSTAQWKDGKIFIVSGNHRIVARPLGPQRTHAFLVVGGTGRGMFPFTAHFSVLPLARVLYLMRDHGSFADCKASGALEADAGISSMFLYAGNAQTAGILRKADGLAMSWSYPVVELTVVGIEILEHTADVLGNPVPGDSGDFRPAFLVRHARLVTANYR